MSQGTINNAPVYTGFTAPTIQSFLTGSGTYTTPAGVKWLRITIVGGGGGGQGNSTGGTIVTTATAGGNTTFGGLTAGGGGVSTTTNWSRAPGGTNSGSLAGASNIESVPGGDGGGGMQKDNTAFGQLPGGQGGASIFGSGAAGLLAAATVGGQPYGSGGGGGGTSSTSGYVSGSGGGAGGYMGGIVQNPEASYSYSVGAGGSGGIGTSLNGTDGRGGLIIVEEFYQLNTYGELLTFTGSGNAVKQTGGTLNQPLINGVTDGSNAAAGRVGEYISSTVVGGSAVGLTTNVAANVTSITLSAGDWDVYGNVAFNISGTGTSVAAGSIGTTSATLESGEFRGQRTQALSGAIGNAQAQSVPMRRYSVTGSTTVYLVALASFTSGTVSAFGRLQARRVR